MISVKTLELEEKTVPAIMSGEPVALKALNKINGKLKFLYRKNKFLTPTLRRMLCNALTE